MNWVANERNFLFPLRVAEANRKKTGSLWPVLAPKGDLEALPGAPCLQKKKLLLSIP